MGNSGFCGSFGLVPALCGRASQPRRATWLADMGKGNYVAASFPRMQGATGAIDWFRNQAIEPGAILVAAVPPDGRPRAPQRGDNERTDLRWIVAVDLDVARIPRSVAIATLTREGGKRLAQVPELPRT